MWASENEGARVLDADRHRTQEPRRSGYFHRLCRWLEGLPEAIEAVFPRTQVQFCIVHLVRNALSFVSHKDREAVAEDLKSVYQASSVEEAERQLAEFEQTWSDVSLNMTSRKVSKNRSLVRVPGATSQPATEC
jgi:putative transposase